jgi:hypothetical protein
VDFRTYFNGLLEWLNRAVNISIAVALFFLIEWATQVIVAEIAHAQV